MRHLLDMLLGRLFLGKLLFRLLHLFGDRGLAGLGLIQHLAGVFRKAGGHSVRLPGLEEQQVFPRFSLIKGIVHIPLPGYPVKEFCIPGQFKAVGGCAVRHEFFSRSACRVASALPGVPWQFCVPPPEQHRQAPERSASTPLPIWRSCAGKYLRLPAVIASFHSYKMVSPCCLS